MLKKKSQISLFIIVAIILIIAVSIPFLYLSLRPKPIAPVTTVEDEHIIGFIEGCTDQKAKQALFYLGFIGGDTWIESPITGEPQDPFGNMYYAYDKDYKIPYHYYGGLRLEPKNEDILSEFMNDNLQYCIKDFQNFKEKADFEYNQPETGVLIKPKEVIFNINFPVKVKRLDKESQLGPVFTAKIPLRLYEMDKISREIVNFAKDDPSIIHWDRLSEINEQGFNMTAYTGVAGTLIYRIIDTKYKIDNNEYVYQFCVKV